MSDVLVYSKRFGILLKILKFSSDYNSAHSLCTRARRGVTIADSLLRCHTTTWRFNEVHPVNHEFNVHVRADGEFPLLPLLFIAHN